MIKQIFLGIILLTLFVLAAALVLPACGVRFVSHIPLLNYCTPQVRVESADFSGLEDENRDLLARLRRLETDFSNLECEPDRTAENGIDPDLWNQRDVRVLQGCWTLDGDIYRTRLDGTDQITRYVTWEMCFDSEGAGQQTLVSDDGQRRCDGPVTAAYDEDTLVVTDQGDVPCNNNASIVKRVMRCELDTFGIANCLSTHPDRPNSAPISVRLKPKED